MRTLVVWGLVGASAGYALSYYDLTPNWIAGLIGAAIFVLLVRWWWHIETA